MADRLLLDSDLTDGLLLDSDLPDVLLVAEDPPQLELVDVAETSLSVDSATLNVNLPPSILNGDELLILLGINDTPDVTGPAGWTLVNDSFLQNFGRAMLWRRTSDGTDGASALFILSSAQAGSAQCYQIRGPLERIELEFEVVGAQTTNPNPPVLITSWNGSGDRTIWIAAVISGDDDVPTLGYPVGFTDGIDTPCGRIPSNNECARVASARLIDNNGVQNPSIFTLDSTERTASYTIGLRAAGVSIDYHMII